MLLEREVDVDLEDYEGKTALVVAVNNNCKDIVKLLLDHTPPAFVNHTRVSPSRIYMYMYVSLFLTSKQGCPSIMTPLIMDTLTDDIWDVM